MTISSTIQSLKNVFVQDSLFKVTQEGKTEKLKFVDKVMYCLSSSYHLSINESMRSYINKSLSSEQENLEDDILSKWSVLSSDIFDRTQIPQQIFHQVVQKVVSNYGYEINRAEQQMNQLGYTAEQVQHFVNAYKDVLVGHSLGFVAPNGNGCSGSYILKGVSFDKDTSKIKVMSVGIFKPALEESHSWSSPGVIQKIKYIMHFCYRNFIQNEDLHRVNNGQGYLAEVVTGKISLDLKSKEAFVPLTGPIAFSPLNKGRGSFQLFEEGCQSAKDKLNVTYKWESLEGTLKEELSQQAFEEYALIKFLAGDMDGHSENMLINSEGKVVAIDGGLSFSPSHSRSFFENRNRHLFSAFNSHSQQPFSTNAKNLVKDYPLDLFRTQVTALYIRESLNSSQWDVEERIARFEERLAFLKEKMNEDWSIQEILRYQF